MSVQVHHLHTVSELEQLLREGENYELVHGELIGMAPTKAAHGLITVEILYFLRHFVKTHPLGLVFGTEMGIKFSENDLLGVDGAFVSKARLTSAAINDNGWLVVAPELVIEVASKSNTAAELDQKLETYFKYGVRQVWIIYPTTQKVLVYTTPDDSKTLRADEMLTGSDILPGFEIRVGDLFADLNEYLP